MLRPESESLYICGQRTNIYFGHFCELQRSMMTSKNLWFDAKGLLWILFCPLLRNLNSLWNKYTVLFESFNKMQRWKEPSTSLPCSLKGISHLFVVGFDLGHSCAFGNRWFLRIILTVALIEAISMLHQFRGIMCNDAKPSIAAIICD